MPSTCMSGIIWHLLFCVFLLSPLCLWEFIFVAAYGSSSFIFIAVRLPLYKYIVIDPICINSVSIWVASTLVPIFINNYVYTCLLVHTFLWSIYLGVKLLTQRKSPLWWVLSNNFPKWLTSVTLPQQHIRFHICIGAPFQILCPLLFWVFHFSCWLTLLSILGMSPLLVIHVANIFFYSVACLFTLFGGV